MSAGTDLEELFETLDAERMMNMIDAIIVEDAISGAMLEGGIEKLRTGILSVYNGAQVSSSTAQQMPGHTVKPAHTYMQMNDEGLLGFEAPLE